MKAIPISLLFLFASCTSQRAATKGNSLDISTGDNWQLVKGADHVEAGIDSALFSWNGSVLHVLGSGADGDQKPFAYLSSKQAFSNYRLRLAFQWGSKRFSPRQHEKRDSGVLVHVHGRHIVWPDSVEMQIQEGDVGDAFTIDTQVTATVTPASVVEIVPMPQSTYAPAGAPHTQGQDGITRVVKLRDVEKPGWNDVEVIACADSLWFIINGTVVNHLRNVRTWRPDATGNEAWVPLSSGHIALQAEGAEIFYKHIQVEPLSAYAGIICK